MKVTLVFPAIGIIGFNNKDYFSGEVSWINHGLASIGANLKAAGHEVNLIDMRRLTGFQEFVTIIEKQNPDYVGINVSSMDYKPALAAVELVSKAIPEAKIMVGGIQPTLFPDRFINNADIDFIVMGEGETAVVKIVDGLIRERMVTGYKEHLDTLQYVDRGLFDYQYEMNAPFLLSGQQVPQVTMIAGRGCPYQCAYCQPAENVIFGSPYRIRSVDNVIGEIEQLKQTYGHKSIMFWDDTFTIDPKWIGEFCNRYKHHDQILANSRADIICNHPEMIEGLASVGLDTMLIGFETGSQRLLNLINKGTTVDQNIKAAEICKKYGVKVFGTFMFGIPTETKTDALLTKAMLMAIKPDYKMMFIFTPIPGTRMFDYCKNNDLLLENEDYHDIARTGVYKRRIKGVDYKMLVNALMV